MTLPRKARFDVRGYSSQDIPGVWPQVSGYIEQALEQGSDYTLGEIYSGLLDCDMQLWTYEPDGIKAAMVTTLQNKGGKRWCLLLAVGGSLLNEWLEYLPAMEDWAKRHGCDEMRVYGRRGWAKVLGYGVDWTRMSKQL